MKGRKATRAERKIIQTAELDTYEYLVQKNTIDFLQVISSIDKKELKIDKKTLLVVKANWNTNWLFPVFYQVAHQIRR